MKTLILKHCNILNGKENMNVINDCDILIQDNKIIKIAKDINEEGKIINCKGKYVIPGLINLHVHLPGSGKPSKKKVSDTSKLISFIKRNALGRKIGMAIYKSHAKDALYSGVTTIRTVGGIADFDSKLRDLIANEKVIGSRIISCDEAIGVKGGHMDKTVAVAANNIEEAIDLVIQRKNQGADWIKLMITGGVLDCKELGHPGTLKMQADMVKACCDKAHELGLKVCAHVEGPEGVEIAIKNGVDTIEHGATVNEELLKEFKARGGALVQTLTPALPFVYLNEEETGYGEDAKINTQALLDYMYDMIKKCRKLGIKVGMGTDVGCPLCTNTGFYHELCFTNKLFPSITPKDAIHIATLLNASIVGLDKEIGSIEEGKIADLVIYDNDPSKDLIYLAKPFFVIKDGKTYFAKVKHNKIVEERLAKVLSALQPVE